jgi:hypothetical protein
MDAYSNSSLLPPIRVVIFDIGNVFFLPWPESLFFNQMAEKMNIPVDRLQQGLWHGLDIEASRLLGIPSILFKSTEQTIAELELILVQRGVVMG